MLRGVPDWWELAILVLGAYRLTRFLGWDEWPPVERMRAWVIGERWVAMSPEGVPLGADTDFPEKEQGTGRVDSAALGLPGKQPSSEVADVRPAYSRPTLAHLVHCPFCLGWWVSLACWGAWVAAGDWALVVLAPFAISGAVGLVSKNLDP